MKPVPRCPACTRLVIEGALHCYDCGKGLGSDATSWQYVAGSLRAAGLDVIPDRTDQILADGLSFRCVPEPGETVSDVYDRIVARAFGSRLLASVQRELPLRSLGIAAELATGGVDLVESGVSVARVSGSHALVHEAGQRVNGNFMAPGGHWGQLLDALVGELETAVRIVSSRTTRPRRTHRSLPDGLSEERLTRALDASKSLRSERSVVYGHPVNLLASDTTLRLQPVRRRQGRLEVPFVCLQPDRWLAGSLSLAETEDPLALYEYAGWPEFVGDAWLIVLLGLAELTCVDRVPAALAPEQHRTSGSQRNPRSTDAIVALASRTHRSTNGLLHGASLAPTEETLRIAGGYVVGHRRRLLPEQSASERARVAAENAGIDLSLDETWVRPHARGLPPNAVLAFTWELD